MTYYHMVSLFGTESILQWTMHTDLVFDYHNNWTSYLEYNLTLNNNLMAIIRTGNRFCGNFGKDSKIY